MQVVDIVRWMQVRENANALIASADTCSYFWIHLQNATYKTQSRDVNYLFYFIIFLNTNSL